MHTFWNLQQLFEQVCLLDGWLVQFAETVTLGMVTVLWSTSFYPQDWGGVCALSEK